MIFMIKGRKFCYRFISKIGVGCKWGIYDFYVILI